MRTSTVDPSLGLEALGFGKPAHPESAPRRSWITQSALLLCLAGLAVAGLFGVYFAGKALLFQPSYGGPVGARVGDECFILDPQDCISLDSKYIEKISGVAFPPGAVVVDSGSTSFLLLKREWAIVRWPEGTQIPEPRRTTIAGRFYTTVDVGIGTDGRPELSVERTWDG